MGGQGAKQVSRPAGQLFHLLRSKLKIQSRRDEQRGVEQQQDIRQLTANKRFFGLGFHKLRKRVKWTNWKTPFCLSILHAPVLTLKSGKGGGRNEGSWMARRSRNDYSTSSSCEDFTHFFLDLAVCPSAPLLNNHCAQPSLSFSNSYPRKIPQARLLHTGSLTKLQRNGPGLSSREILKLLNCVAMFFCCGGGTKENNDIELNLSGFLAEIFPREGG